MTEESRKKTCFVICPIGSDTSPERSRSDQVLKHIVTPVAKACGYTEILRADKIGRPGLISKQIIEHLLTDDLVVADLTARNPNVYYELAIRHAKRKPLVQLLDSTEDLPFDISDTRTIKVDIHDLDSVEACKVELERQILAVEKDPDLVDTPLSAAIDLQASRQSGDPVQKTLAQIMEKINELAFGLRTLERSTLPTVAKRIGRPVSSFVEEESLRSLARSESEEREIEELIRKKRELEKVSRGDRLRREERLLDELLREESKASPLGFESKD
jgi:hypothetical protein